MVSRWLDGLTLSSCLQVAVTAANVRPLQLFGEGQPGCAVLALHPPGDPTQGLELDVPPCDVFQH